MLLALLLGCAARSSPGHGATAGPLALYTRASLVDIDVRWSPAIAGEEALRARTRVAIPEDFQALGPQDAAELAELAEARFGRNDYAPFDYGELASFDAEGCAAVSRLWYAACEPGAARP